MRVVVTGGGTGGHIYPALSLIKELKKHTEVDVLYIGSEHGLEREIVPREEIPFKTIHITGFRRKLSFENVKTVYRFIIGTRRARKMLIDFKPDVVIGTGGYVSAPVVYAAAKLAIPTIIHEQNSVPGLTNKFLSKYVDRIAVSFEQTKSYFPENKVVLTGNPRASEVVSVQKENNSSALQLNPNKKTVLIVGGSRGARPINEAFLANINAFGSKDYEVIYVTGAIHYDEVMEKVKNEKPANVIIKPFIHNFPSVLAAVHLIVARAGATTIAEITALGLPSILIPSPYVTNNHQEKNANALKQCGASFVCKEDEISGERLVQYIDSILLDETKWTNMKEATYKLGMPKAALHIHTMITELIEQKSI